MMPNLKDNVLHHVRGEGSLRAARRSLGILMTGVCLLFMLTGGATTAFAAASWYGGSYPEDETNSLTIEATNNDEMVADIAKANVVADVYRVATMTKNTDFDTYTYTWEQPFGSGTLDTSGLDADGWQELVRVSCTEAKLAGAVSETFAAGATYTPLENGLYLIVPHGKDIAVTFDSSGAPVLTAKSETYQYSFVPSMVSLPSKTDLEGTMSGTIKTSEEYGEWQHAITIEIKPGRKSITEPSEDTSKKTSSSSTGSTGSTGSSGTSSSRTAVRTGDETDLLPFYVIMSVSGGAILFMIYDNLQRRRKERGASGR